MAFKHLTSKMWVGFFKYLSGGVFKMDLSSFMHPSPLTMHPAPQVQGAASARLQCGSPACEEGGSANSSGALPAHDRPAWSNQE